MEVQGEQTGFFYLIRKVRDLYIYISERIIRCQGRTENKWTFPFIRVRSLMLIYFIWELIKKSQNVEIKS